MELKRGKTFIKSSLHITREKSPGPAAAAPARDDAGPWSVSPGGQQQVHGERGPQVSLSTHGYNRCSKKGAQRDPESGATDLCGAAFKLVWKSKTHNSVPGAGRMVTATGPLVGSSSFPGPSGSQRIIDYRHFVPQMPFVPAVAKSIPRKRISLKRPKKCFQNLFHIHRNKTENLASLATKGKNLPSPRSQSEDGGQRGKAFFPMGEGLGLDGLCQDLSDSEFLPDSSFDFCKALCEDVASLKSFDSLTGCGEIFADESSVPSLELNEGLESSAWSLQALGSKVSSCPFQGSLEKLVSPAQNDMSDFAKFWDSVNHSVRQQQRALLGPGLEGPQETDIAQPRMDSAGLIDFPLCPCRDLLSGSKTSSIDTGTPKSELPESVSTSDEGYYDAFSPSLEEDRKEAVSPAPPAASFPRESYSGDALYELFYDPSEDPVGQSLDDELCVSESLSEPPLEAPLSICSFHMGAEENLASGPGPDLLSQGFLQSSWKGKECLLKLCDTELTITMGIINWLRRGPEFHALPVSTTGELATPLRGLADKLGSGSEEKRPDLVKLEGREAQASDAGGIKVCSRPSRKDLWVHLGTKGLLTEESEVLAGAKQGTSSLSRDLSLKCVQVSEEEEIRGFHEGSFSSLGSAASVMTGTSSKNKVINPFAWPHSQELRAPGNLGRPGLRESTLDTEPTLKGCVAQVAALQIHPDSEPQTVQPPRQNTSSRLCRQHQARDINIPQQKEPNSFPGVAAICGLPSLTSLLHSPEDQKCPGLFMDISQLRVEPTRLDTQACASVEEQPLTATLWRSSSV
ncbi:PREDICTED: APC membrane recruitment protein 3 [Miniopterus natalensis]|uniref:APC membrane recruitment protein 3 n=1 Tax=Miniopterus natalensis TaxID=291302 RepID=UPI0007A6EC0E|nr:PREDICTED: APC membrane recruitment protein 3 [Miniopterus natalensis]